jgi:hypothetical protein
LTPTTIRPNPTTSPSLETTINTPTSPLAALATAEAHLVGAIDEATARLDDVATGAVEKALARYAQAAQQAAERIAHAFARVNDLAAGVLASLQGAATTITEQIATGRTVQSQQATPPALPTAPAVEQPPADSHDNAAVSEAVATPAVAVELAGHVDDAVVVATAANPPVERTDDVPVVAGQTPQGGAPEEETAQRPSGRGKRPAKRSSGKAKS